jgi:DNA-binding transcriptional regulator YdaS (Cro superfamily)
MKPTALQQACLNAGGQTKLANLLGTTQSKVWYWLKRAKKGVAGEYVLEIERHTGVSRHTLRPDL